MKKNFKMEGLIELLKENPKTEGCDLSESTNLINELGYDSIDLMQLIVSIENKLEIDFSIADLDVEKVMVVKELYKIIQSKVDNESTS